MSHGQFTDSSGVDTNYIINSHNVAKKHGNVNRFDTKITTVLIRSARSAVCVIFRVLSLIYFYSFYFLFMLCPFSMHVLCMGLVPESKFK